MTPLRLARKLLGLLLRPWKRLGDEVRGFGQEAWLSVITHWEGSRGDRYRYRYYRKRLGALGPGSTISAGVRFEHPERIFIGSRTHLDRGCLLVGSPADLDLSGRHLARAEVPGETCEPGRLVIGDDCHLAQGTMVFAHGGVILGDLVTLSAGAKVYSLTSLPDSPVRPGGWSSIQPYSGLSPSLIGPVILGRNVWLGLDVLVFPGVVVGEDSFVRSRSVVTRSCPPNSHLAGDPARYRKPRFGNLKEGNR